MSGTANASIDVIERFKSANTGFDGVLNEYRSAAFQAISQLMIECESKLKSYEGMAAEAEELLSKARARRSQANAQLKEARAFDPKSVAANKQELKILSEARREQIEKASNAASAANGLVERAESLYSYFKSQCSKIQQMMGSLSKFESDVYPMVDNTLASVQSVNSGLQSAINAINDYISTYI